MTAHPSRTVILAATAVSIIIAFLPLDVAGPLTLLWAVGCSVALTVLVRRLPRDRRSPWKQLTVAGWLIALGVLVRAIHGELVGVEQPLPSPADLIHIPAYLIFLWAAVLIHRARSGRSDLNAWLDAFIVAIGIAIPLWAIGFAPFATDASIPAATRALSLGYNSITLVAVAVFVRITATPGTRPPAYYLLGMAGVTFFIADIAVVFSTADQGVAISVVLSPMTYGLVLAALCHRSAQEIMHRHEEAEERVRLLRHVMMGLAVLSPIVALSLFPAIGWPRFVAAGLAVALAAGVIARLSALLRFNQHTADSERLLSAQISRLATFESSERIAEELPRSAALLIGPRHRVALDAEHPDAQLFLESSLGPKGTGLNVLGQHTSFLETRLLRTLVRDADLLGRSADAVINEAEQRSQAEANRKIAANEKRFRALVQNSSDIVAVLDAESGEVTYMSDSVERVLGLSAEEFLGRTLEWVAHRNDWDFARDYMEAILDGTELDDDHEIRIRDTSGNMRLLQATLTDMRNVEGIDGVVVNASDVTEKRALERDLRDAETIDPLTLLLNRNAFIRESDAAIRRASVRESSVAMAIVNVDGFRLVNEAYGTPLADEVLIELARRVRQTVRSDDSVARLNGDEFGILMPSGFSTTEAEASVERVLEELSEPVSIAGRSVALSATAGLVNDIDLNSTAIELLRDADTALDAAKQTNRGSVLHFDEAMGEEVSEKMEVRNQLLDAIRTGKLRLNFQPIVDMERGHIVSLEALARWTDADRGEIPPSVFIPIAESSGMISELGEWALRSACEHLAMWEKAGHAGFSVSVNMSGHQLREENVIGRMRHILEDTGVDPERITIEITESVLIDDTDFIAERIRSLRELGLRLSIDDFGTGYSSLSYLRRYGFDVLKIDRSFVVPLANDENKREREIVNAMIKLAQALGAVTVAEGIEENEEYAVLRTLGCDYAQGYLFYRPLEAEQIPEVLLGDAKRAAA